MKTYEKVRQFREQNNFTQEKMAEQLNLTPSSYAKLERGETKINIERLQQIANILNIDIKELLNDDNGVLKLAISLDNSGEQYQNCEMGENLKEIKNLKTELKYKDTIIADKETIIKSQNTTIQSLEREILSLQKTIKLLENK